MKKRTIILLRYSPLLILALVLCAIPAGRLMAGGGGLLKADPGESHFHVDPDSLVLNFETLRMNTGLVGEDFWVRYTRGGGGGHSRVAWIDRYELRNNSEGVFRFAIQSPKDAQISPLMPPSAKGKQFTVFVDPGKTPGLTPGEKKAQLVLVFKESEDQGPPEVDSVTIELRVMIDAPSGPGTIYPARVRVLSDTVAVGEQFNLQLRLDSLPTPLPPDQSGFGCTISWNASLALPIDSMPELRINGGEAVLDLHVDTFSGPIAPGRVLLSIPMRGLLGDARSTEIILRNFHWDAQGTVSPVRVSGELTVKDIYTDSGSIYNGAGHPRLVNANGDGLGLSVVPDLLKTDAEIAATYGTFALLKIYDLSGVEVGDLSKSLSPASGTPITVKIPITREQFVSPGTYLLRLTTRGSTLTRMIIVE